MHEILLLISTVLGWSGFLFVEAQRGDRGAGAGEKTREGNYKGTGPNYRNKTQQVRVIPTTSGFLENAI